MKVPFLDLKSGYLEIQSELDEVLINFCKSGQYIGGLKLQNFEENFAIFVEAASCVGLANGLDAIKVSLTALGIGDGDEVIVPAHTFIATWLAVTSCGATPVPVDCDPLSYSIDFKKINQAITKKTKAIIPVHLYGQPVDLDPIIELAKLNNLFVIEDAAQAHGAFYKSKRIGGHSDVVAWSFYPGKNLGAFGDGGAITTNNSDLSEKIRVLSNYGAKKKYVHDKIGINSRLDPMQAIILDIKLKHLDNWNNRRRKIAKKYLTELKGLGLILPDHFSLSEGAWHLFPVRTNRRDELLAELTKKDIDAIIHYPIPPHNQKSYSKDFNHYKLPVAEEVASQLLSLPIGPHLEMDAVDFVIDTIKIFLK